MSFMTMLTKKFELPTPQEALLGRERAIWITEPHAVNGRPLDGDIPQGHDSVLFSMGNFWAPERLLWRMPGAYVTSVGFAGGFTRNPTYNEVCTGRTGHALVARIVFDPKILSREALLRWFWETHDPTQGMRQGNDMGTHYRSAIYWRSPEMQAAAEKSAQTYQTALQAAGHTRSITTEIREAPKYYLAENRHQQYLAKNPGEHRALAGVGVDYPAW